LDAGPEGGWVKKGKTN